MNNLIAFHNDPKIQKKYIDRVKLHYKADEIIQGKYWENGKGCAVGCTIENDGGIGNWHQRYEDKLGIPRALAYLEDKIFEGLSNGDAKKFPVDFLNAINIGADLSKIVPQLMIWLLSDKTDGVIKYAKPDCVKIIKKICALYKRKLKGGDVSSDEWYKVRDEAWSVRTADAYASYSSYSSYASAYASAYAADAAAASYASYAAYDAAASADAAASDDAYASYSSYASDASAYAYASYAASAASAASSAASYASYASYASAASSAASAADASASRRVFYKKMAAKLIKLLKAAK